MAENNFAQNAATDIVIDALMGVTDPAAIATDILLDQLIDALVSHYATAAAEIEEKGAKYFNKFKDADAKKFADFQAGKITKDDYTKWRAQKMLTGDHYKDLKNVLVSDMNNANQIAVDIINNKKPDVYALNHNYGVYEIEHSTGLATSYVMYDHDTVENLIAENPQILPKNKIDIPADKKWNTQKINNALTQGVLQGESIPDISKRLQDVTDMNKNAAIRNARTAVTGAQNAGRDDSYRRAESMGIPVSQIWISTIDGRTRHSHRAMMGEVRKGKTFSNGLRYPGDPWGAGEEVYNCRCTMIANVNDVDYGIEDMVNSKLKEKGMTWDEWVNEQPLSKHNGESKAHYLQRYSEHKKKLSFKEWLGEQADPDSAITSMWGKKGWSNVFYDIQNKSHADANALKKELTALANQNGVKPKDIWSQYLTGQLDAEDMNKLENILKKYLPDTGVSNASDAIASAVNAATSAGTSLDNISDATKKAIADLNLTAGNPMTKIEADTYKVNPMYSGVTGDPSHINCQTATFAYECRRQGYDVVALTKDSSVKDVFDLQDKLGKDQGEGWINKVTGKKPDALISHGTGITQSLSEMLDELENAVGKNGERYTLGVRFKSGGSHAVNLDRDENGLLRIIDNQKGAPLKNTWVGKEVEDYFSMKGVERIRKVYRVDDCVPNPEFFNKIVKQSPTSIVKTSLAKGDDVAKILDDIKDNLSGALVINILLGDNWSEYISIMSKNHSGEGAIDELWQKYLKGDLKDPDLDKLISKMYGLDVVPVQNVEKIANKIDNMPNVSIPKPAPASTSNIDLDMLKDKKVMDVYHELEAEGTHGKFYKELKSIGEVDGLKQGDVWKKYLAGELGAEDVAKIEKYLDKYKIADKTDDIAKHNKEILKFYEDKSLLDANVPMGVADIAQNKYFKAGLNNASEYWNKYKFGEIKDAEIDKILGIKKTTDKIDDFVNPYKGKDVFDVLLTDPKLQLGEPALEYLKTNFGKEGAKHLQKWANGEVVDTKLNELLLGKKATKADDLAEIKKTLPVKYEDLDNISQDLLDAVDDYFFENHFSLKDSKVQWEKYVKGEISDPVLDKILKDKLPTASTMSKAVDKAITTPEVDLFALQNKSMSQVFNELKADKLNSKFYTELQKHGKPSEVWEKYLNGELTDDASKKIDDILIKKYNKTAADKPPAKMSLDEFKKTVTDDYLDLDDQFGESIGNKIKHTLSDNYYNTDYSKKEYWKKYLSGEIQDKDLDNILLGQIPEPIKNTQAAEKSEELIKAEKKLEKAQDELKAAEEALKKNVDISEVWDGIWKEDVTLADYAKKKSTIDAKKVYYEEEIEKLQNDLDYKSWLSEEDKQQKIWDLQHLYDKLENFEEAGKKAEAYYDAVEKAKKKITKAQQEVHKFSPGPNVESNGYSQARKDTAKWPKSRDAANNLYLAHSEQEWNAATATEREAIKHYTQSYHKFNEPLRGIQYGSSAYKGVGNTDLNAGSANNGKRLNAMTDYLEKCSSEYDQWLQRGVHFSGMDKFLQIDMNKLRYGTEKELQDALLGKNVTEYGFMSCGSAKGKGFDGDILFNIFTPAGTKMSYAEYYSYYKGGSEVETILQQGSQFIITKVEKTSGQIYIDLEFVGNLPPQRYTK